MSISLQTARSQFTLSSKPETLTIPWYFLASGDLKVVRTRSGVDTDATLSTHYTVAGAGNEAGGSVTILNHAFWTVGDTVTVHRAAQLVQPADYPLNGQFPSATAEASADRMTMLLQQLQLGLERSIRVPATNAALAELTKTGRANKVLTFDTNGDVSLAAIDPTGTGATNNLVLAAGSTTARTLGVRFGEVFSVEDYGAAGDGVTDDKAAIQAAVDAAEAAGGGVVRLLAKTYLVSGAVTVEGNNITIEGQGRATQIKTTSATANHFEVGNGTDEVRNFRLRDVLLYSSVTKSAGACVYARKLCRSVIENVFCSTPELHLADGNRIWNGLVIAEFDNVLVSQFYCLMQNDGIVIYGNSGQTFGAEFYLTGNSRILRGRYGIHIAGGAGGVDLGDCDVSLCENGVRVSDDLGGAYNREVFIGSEFTSDANQTNAGRGVLFDTNSTVYAEVVGAWFASNDVGIEIQPGQPSGAAFKFSGVRIYNQRESGIIINDGEVILDGCSISLNGQGGSGGHGIWKATASSDLLIVSNCIIANNGSSGVGYGLVIVASCDNFNVEGNSFAGNVQGALSNGSSVGLTKLIRNNLGLVTENNGTAQITTGNTSVAVNHGLHDTPTFVGVSFAGPQDAGSQVYVAPSSFTSTQFTITLSASAGANRDFTWTAIRGPQ